MKPIEHQLRPKGLGLEADRSALKDLEPNKRQRPPKPGEERAKEEELVMGPGGCVLVQSGAHKDLYGKVECQILDQFETLLIHFGSEQVQVHNSVQRVKSRRF